MLKNPESTAASHEPAVSVATTNKARHLRQIQAIVVRMSVASAVVKLWSTLIVITVLFVSKNYERAHWLWLAVFLTIVFWVIDAHLRRQARLFRKHRQRVAQLDEADIDFDMNISHVDSPTEALSSVFWSPSVMGFYGALVIGGVWFALGVGLS